MAQQQAVNPLSLARQEYYQHRMNVETQALKKLQAEMAALQGKSQQLRLQLQENSMVDEELNIMEDTAVVYKLIGPALVSQAPDDAKAVVSKRLEYINSSLKDVDKNIATCNTAYEKAKIGRNKVQEDFKAEVEQLLKQSQQQSQ
ncbi:putative prefoldin subunit 6 [Diplonema papillatum]|nr:putative prefoldin subunit 6 [Diplonema papillatum]